MARISPAVCLLLLVSLSTVYEVQGTFLLKLYLRKFNRKSMEFRPFACKGMLKFVDLLEGKCPLKPEFKNFFGTLRSFMGVINSASGSKNIDVDLKGKAEGVQSAMSALAGKVGSSVDTSKVMDVLMSMGKALTSSSQTSTGSTGTSTGSTGTSTGSTVTTEMTSAQRKELVMSMLQCARVIGQFVATTAAKSGSSIDISSLGVFGNDANAAADAAAAPSGAMAAGPASFTTQSALGGSSFGGSFSDKTGANFAGSVNYQGGTTASQQTTTGF